MRRSFCKTGPIWVALLLLAAPAIADYRQKAETQTAYIQDHVWGPQARMYRDSDPKSPMARLTRR